MVQEFRTWCFIARISDMNAILMTGWKGDRLYSTEEGALKFYQAHSSDPVTDLRVFEVDLEEVKVNQAGGKDNYGNYIIAKIPGTTIKCVRTISTVCPVVTVEYTKPDDPKRWVTVDCATHPVDDGLKIPMEIVYIAHPVSGDVEANIAKVRAICRQLHTEFRLPLAPYAFMCQYLDDTVPEQRELGIKSNLFFFQKRMIDEMWLYGDRISEGMFREIIVALHYGIPVVPKSENTWEAYGELDLVTEPE